MADLAPVFADLRALMAPYAPRLDAKKDTDQELYLDTRVPQKNKKPAFFGAVQLKKAYVSYHLMPVYAQPELLAGLSPALKARMQGKSCFNFTASDAVLLGELAALTRAAFERYEAQGLV